MKIRLHLVPILLATAGLLVFSGEIAYGSADEAIVSRFLRYRDLTRLTAEQVDVAESVQTMCRDPKTLHGPHIKPGIHLYISQAAIDARRKNPAVPHYPVGTLLVKEKFESKGGSTPDIITVMEKIANEGKVDDWQFHMIRIADRTIVRDGFRVSCIGCHSRYTESNFVSRVTDSLVSAFALTGAPGQPAKRLVFAGGNGGGWTVRYLGGDGTAPEKAVIIVDAGDEAGGVHAETAWIADQYPGAKKTGQARKRFGGRTQDEITITTAAGEEKKVYFDISGAFRKS